MHSVEGYFERIYSISAGVFCAGIEAAAQLYVNDPHAITQLRKYGMALGTIIQLRDDASDSDSLLFRTLERSGVESDTGLSINIIINEYAMTAIESLESADLVDTTYLQDYIGYLSG